METTFVLIKIENDPKYSSGFENSLDEVVRKLKEGYSSGFDSNEDESYQFETSDRKIVELLNTRN